MTDRITPDTPGAVQPADPWQELAEFVQRERALIEAKSKGGQHVGYSPSITPSVLKNLERILQSARAAVKAEQSRLRQELNLALTDRILLADDYKELERDLALRTQERDHLQTELAWHQEHHRFLQGESNTLAMENDDLRRERDEARQELERVTVVCEASNAVCACGCPVGEHENYGEDGEACENEDHECVRTSAAVADMLELLRAQLAVLTHSHEAALTLVETWLKQQADYPSHSEGQHAAAAVRCCAKELSAALTPGKDS